MKKIIHEQGLRFSYKYFDLCIKCFNIILILNLETYFLKLKFQVNCFDFRKIALLDFQNSLHSKNKMLEIFKKSLTVFVGFHWKKKYFEMQENIE